MLDEGSRAPCVRYLARVCGWHSILPSSVRISSPRRVSPLGSGAHSTVWVGRNNDRKVVVKVMNCYLSDGEEKKRKLVVVGRLVVTRC